MYSSLPCKYLLCGKTHAGIWCLCVEYKQTIRPAVSLEASTHGELRGTM